MSGVMRAHVDGHGDRLARPRPVRTRPAGARGRVDRIHRTAASRTAGAGAGAGPPPLDVVARRPDTPVELDTPTGPCRPARGPRVRRLATAAAAAVVLALAASQWSLLVSSAAALAHLRWGWVPLVLLAEVSSKAAVAGTHRRLLRAGGSRPAFRSVLAIVYAGNAVSLTLPVVGAELATAVNYREFTRRGASQAAAGWTMLVSGVASAGAFAVLIAAGAAATGTGLGALLGAAGALLVALPGWAVIVLLRRAAVRRRLLVRAEALLARLPAGADRPARAVRTALPRLLEQLGLLRLPGRAWATLALLALANWLADCLALAAAIAATGGAVPWSGLLLAYLAGAGITTLAVTPGGLGTVELGLTAALIAAGLDAGHALTAALAYRLVTLWLATGAGWAGYAVLARLRRGDRLQLVTP